MTGRMTRSQRELARLVEAAVTEICQLPRERFWFVVKNVVAHGHPPERLEVWATLHFLTAGSPFCCGEPGCHMGLRGERLERVGDHVRRAMGLEQRVTVEFGKRNRVEYHEEVRFHYGPDTEADDSG